MKKLIFTFVFFLFTGLFELASAQSVKINHNGTDGLLIESDGTLVAQGAATTWDDFVVYPYSTTSSGTNQPTWTKFAFNGASQGVFLWGFSATIEQEVYFTMQLPHTYKVGTDILPHVHWTTTLGTPTSESNNDVVWGLEYSIVSIGGAYNVTSTISTTRNIIPAITPTGTMQHLISSFPAISGSSFGISTILTGRLYRVATDSNDKFANPALMLSMDFHYEIDTQGSRTEFTK